MQNYITYLVLLLASLKAPHGLANPYSDPAKIQVDSPELRSAAARLHQQRSATAPAADGGGSAIWRVEVRWNENTDDFAIETVEQEFSGTEALAASARYDDPHGSYQAKLVDPVTGQATAFAVIGTGAEYRKLSRMLSFRFPAATRPMRFELKAEHPDHGRKENVLTHLIDPRDVSASPVVTGLEVRLLRPARQSPKLLVNVYAEAYQAGRRNQFWIDAARVPAVFEQNRFPLQEHFEIRAVFAPSALRLDRSEPLGLPVPERNSFLGLYFPYWTNFSRYHHIVYPTREIKFRRAVGSVAYDYPIVIVDTAAYWGMGNFKEFTAVPARSDRFTYLLQHEFGHFFGLNEEYSNAGTELAFAPQINEPWSQNITFASERPQIKWQSFIQSNINIPTPASTWSPGQYGVYQGGYGGLQTRVYKPGLSCIMASESQFCAICSAAINQRIKMDLGLAAASDQSCSCQVDPSDQGTCALFKGGSKIAWTKLFNNRRCDAPFCAEFFQLTRRHHCH